MSPSTGLSSLSPADLRAAAETAIFVIWLAIVLVNVAYGITSRPRSGDR